MTTSLAALLGLALLSLGMAAAGVYLLFGLGWALLLGSVITAAGSLVLYKGMTDEK